MLPLLVFFEGSKINVTKVAIFDENMAVGKSENLVTLHPYDLKQPFFRGYFDFALSFRFNYNFLDYRAEIHQILSLFFGKLGNQKFNLKLTDL